MLRNMPKKQSMKQLEKRQDGKKEKDKGRVEKTIGSLDIPDMNSEELMGQLQKMKAITPTALAIQLSLKVSMAKRLLESLQKDGVVNMVSRSHNLKVYALRP
jgi:small subunit ribosomal protein S25e